MDTTKSKTGLVKKMRKIRDQLSREIMEMTFEQEKSFIKSQLEKLKYNKTHNPRST